MNDRANPQPYSTSRPLSGGQASTGSRFGLLVGISGMLLGASPIFYSLYVLGGLWRTLESMSSKPQSIEAMGLSTISFLATGIGFAVCCPLALLCGLMAAHFCSKTGALLARIGSLCFLAPIPLLLAGAWIVCRLNGIQFHF